MLATIIQQKDHLHQPLEKEHSTAHSVMNRLLHLNEEKDTCRIPMDQTHQHMIESYAASVQEGKQPEWMNTPERERNKHARCPFY